MCRSGCERGEFEDKEYSLSGVKIVTSYIFHAYVLCRKYILLNVPVGKKTKGVDNCK
jgi:hypothetical protein